MSLAVSGDGVEAGAAWLTGVGVVIDGVGLLFGVAGVEVFEAAGAPEFVGIAPAPIEPSSLSVESISFWTIGSTVLSVVLSGKLLLPGIDGVLEAVGVGVLMGADEVFVAALGSTGLVMFGISGALATGSVVEEEFGATEVVIGVADGVETEAVGCSGCVIAGCVGVVIDGVGLLIGVGVVIDGVGLPFGVAVVSEAAGAPEAAGIAPGVVF